MIFGKEAFTDELIRDPNIVSVLSTSEICVRGTTFAPWIFIRVQTHSKKWWPIVDDNNTGLPKIQICLSDWWVLKHPVNKDKCSSLLHEFWLDTPKTLSAAKEVYTVVKARKHEITQEIDPADELIISHHFIATTSPCCYKHCDKIGKLCRSENQ